MSSARNQISILIERDGDKCHYCTRQTHRTPNQKRTATREHIVPKFLGGENYLDNYVLACASCNNKRGNQIFYCECKICSVRIRRAIADQTIIDKAFKDLLQFNKPRIRIIPSRTARGKFLVHIGHCKARSFHKFEDAIEFANSGDHINRKAYK